MTSLPIPNKYVRRSIVDLRLNYPIEFGCFIMALKNLEESDDWYRICGIHGNTFKPNDTGVLCPTDPKVVEKAAETGEPVYCKHRVYSFIAWHAPYLYQFELLLNKYNKSKNRNYITLPWLDLTKFSQGLDFLNAETLTIMYDDEEITVRNPFTSATYYDLSGNCVPVTRNGYLTPTTNEQIITLNTIRKQLENTQFAESYEVFSSIPVIKTSEAKLVNTPLETPHNTCHDVIGGDGGNMSDISISAFDPLFWLHHSNMDRFYYNWLFNKTNGFTRQLADDELKPTTAQMTHAPFFASADLIFEQNPNTYAYGWTNNTNQYQILSEVLSLDMFPYTYEPVQMSTSSFIPTNSYIDILNIPIPMETLVIKAYITPKDTIIFDRDQYFAGLVVWLGINRNQIHCSRCEVTRTDLRIDIDSYCRTYHVNSSNADNYNIVLEAYGKNTNTKYTEQQIIQDGSLVVHIQ